MPWPKGAIVARVRLPELPASLTREVALLLLAIAASTPLALDTVDTAVLDLA